MEILDPVADDAAPLTRLSPRLTGLKGKVVGLRVQWDSFDVFCVKLEELLRAECGVGDVVRLKFDLLRAKGLRAGKTNQVAKEVEDFARKVDAAVLGLGA